MLHMKRSGGRCPCRHASLAGQAVLPACSERGWLLPVPEQRLPARSARERSGAGGSCRAGMLSPARVCGRWQHRPPLCRMALRGQPSPREGPRLRAVHRRFRLCFPLWQVEELGLALVTSPKPPRPCGDADRTSPGELQ